MLTKLCKKQTHHTIKLTYVMHFSALHAKFLRFNRNMKDRTSCNTQWLYPPRRSFFHFKPTSNNKLIRFVVEVLDIFLVFGILEIGVGWLQMLMSVFPFYTKYLAWPGNSRLCVTNSLWKFIFQGWLEQQVLRSNKRNCKPKMPVPSTSLSTIYWRI